MGALNSPSGLGGLDPLTMMALLNQGQRNAAMNAPQPRFSTTQYAAPLTTAAPRIPQSEHSLQNAIAAGLAGLAASAANGPSPQTGPGSTGAALQGLAGQKGSGSSGGSSGGMMSGLKGAGKGGGAGLTGAQVAGLGLDYSALPAAGAAYGAAGPVLDQAAGAALGAF